MAKTTLKTGYYAIDFSEVLEGATPGTVTVSSASATLTDEKFAYVDGVCKSALITKKPIVINLSNRKGITIDDGTHVFAFFEKITASHAELLETSTSYILYMNGGATYDGSTEKVTKIAINKTAKTFAVTMTTP